MKHLLPVSLFLLASVLAVGCAAPTDEDAASDVQNLDASVGFRVFGFGTEKRIVEYGTRERVFGTRRVDDRLKEEMLPGVRAKAAASLAEACAAMTNGTGRLDGAAREAEVRAERIFRPTELIVEVRTDQTCVAKRDAMEARATELVAMMEGAHVWNARSALAALKEKATQPIIDAIESRIGGGGRLDLAEDRERGVTNWTLNHVIRLAQLLADLETSSPRAIPALERLKVAVTGGNGSSWATGEIDRAIAKLAR